MDILFLLTSLVAGAVPLIWRVLKENTKLRGYLVSLEYNETFKKFLDLAGIKLPKPKESYEVRMDRLINKFNEVSTESDQIIYELETNLRNKKLVVDELGKQQSDLAQRIEELKKAPEFITLQIQAKLDKMDAEQKRDSRKGAFRDYSLYALGVLTPFLISWIASYFNVSVPTP
jgi:hypothetical protein